MSKILVFLVLLIVAAQLDARSLTQAMDEVWPVCSATRRVANGIEQILNDATEDQIFFINRAAQFEEYAIADVSNRWESLSKAIYYLQKAITIGGDHSQEALLGMGRLCASVGRLGEALLYFEAAVDSATVLSDKAAYLGEMAKLLLGMNRGTEAIGKLLVALKLNPNQLNLYLPLVLAYRDQRSMSFTEWQLLIRKIEVAIEQQVRGRGILGDLEWSRSSSNAVGRDVYWALFEAYDEMGQYSQAWRYLEKAQKFVTDYQNRHSKTSSRTIRGEFSSDDMLLHHILDDYAKGSARVSQQCENCTSSRGPIFLVGMPRSGVEAVGLMLCSHVDIFCDGEDSIFSGASFVALKRDLIAAYLTAPSISNGSEVQAVLDAFRDSFFKRSYGQLGGIQFQQIKQIFLDTALTNYREIHLIQQVFPHSTIINVVRDPMDTLLSCFRYQYHNIDSEWALNGVDLLDEYVGYLKTMSFYRKQYPDSILLINFEALVRDKKSLIRLVLEHIGARWDVKNIFSVMPYNDSVLYSFSTKSFVCVKSELQRHGIGAWKNYSEEISHIRQSILKSLSILQESKTILPFDDSMNWAISEDFDYNQQSSPGYFLPSNLKLFRNLSIDRKYGLPFIISNITTALLVPDFLIAPRGISVLYRYGGPMKTLRPLGTRLAFKTGTVRLVQQREGLLLHILRLHAPFRISSVDRKRQISKRRSLPVADKDKRILSLQDRSVVRGVHLQAVLLEMRHLLGLQAEIPYNQSISVEDLVAYGYCSLTSNMQNRYEKAAEVFKELQAHFKTTKQQKGSNMCLVDVGYVLAKIGQSNIVSTNITAFKMPTESKLHWGASDIAEAVNALVSRGAFEEASKIIAEALSRDIHDHAALCILKIQIAWILLKLGSFDAALKHARAVENEFPSLLQAHVLKAEILIAMGDPKRAFDELHQSMLHPDPPISDPYVEEHTVLISLSRISPSWMELIFSSLVPAILEKIGANCSIAQSADHTLSFVESLISLDFIMRHLRWLCDRSQLLQPEHVAILSVADTSQDLNIKVLSALTVHQLVLGRSSMSLMYISRLIELQPDHDSILIAMARNKIHHPDNFLLAVDILDHALLMHKHVKCNAWFFREILYFWAAHLDVHISSTRIYEELSRKVRVGAIATAGIEICDLSLVSTWNTTALRFLQDYNSKRASKTRDISDKKSATKGLLNYTLELTKFIPYTANASIFTDRELIAMGLAAIAISKLQLRCSSSVFVGSKIDPGAESVLNDMDCKTKNFFTVSDLLDSSVKWLQFIDIMEPTLNRNENVLNVLVDIPTRFFEGKYKHTAFVLFQAGVIEKAKDLFHQVTEFQMRDFLGFIHAATNVEELCAVAGFEIAGLVETTVHSISKKDTMLPGVSLLISTKSGLKQIAYKISSSPRRTALYYMELEFIAERMAVAFSNDVHSEEILLLALDFFFYFIHLSPFQSGNQKIGYSILTGILLMAGETILYPIEELAFSMHLEWEALLCSHPTKFREAVASIFSFKTFIIDDTTTTARSIDFDYHMIDTPRKILNFLNSE